MLLREGNPLHGDENKTASALTSNTSRRAGTSTSVNLNCGATERRAIQLAMDIGVSSRQLIVKTLEHA